jgi:AcrR family transcriptional regulator
MARDQAIRAISQICKAAMSGQISTRDWVEAGLDEMAKSGVHGVRVEVLAQRLGVTKGGFYRRFEDRRGLLDAILNEWASGRIAAIYKVAETTRGEPPLDRLRTVARVYTERVSVQGMSIELAIRQWARTDRSAAAACKRVDEARLKLGAQPYRDLGFSEAEAQDRALFFYSFLFGQSLLFVEHGPRKVMNLTGTVTQLLTELPREKRIR